MSDNKDQESTAPTESGMSEGGSRIYEYGEENAKPTFGFVEDSEEFQMRREQAYSELFGDEPMVYHELMPWVPHIDVYEYPPNKDREFYTYVSSGMSDLPMNIPASLGREFRRVELIFYAEKQDRAYAETLRFMAHFAHDNKTWLHWEHTMPNGNPPQAVFDSKSLDTFLFTRTIVEPDSDIDQKLVLDGDPVNLLWLVPITSAECELKLHQGSDALYALFNEVDHPFVFSGDRQSYV